MKLKLTLEDRLLLHTLYPQATSYPLWKALRTTRERINFNEEETRKYDISSKQVGDQQEVQFNKEASANHIVEVDIPRAAMDFFIKTLKDLSSKEKLPEMYFDLYEKIVG